MKTAKFFALFISMACATASWGDIDKYSDLKGEYYEYDLVGSPKDEAMHVVRHYAKQIATAPLRAVRWTCIKGHHTTKKIITTVRQFFSSSRSINGQRSQIQYALNNWQSELDHNNYNNLEGRDRDVSLTIIASDSWYLLKSALYNAGVRLPKETVKTLKSFVYGACNCVAE
jgi:hypothetical protein